MDTGWANIIFVCVTPKGGECKFLSFYFAAGIHNFFLTLQFLLRFKFQILKKFDLYFTKISILSECGIFGVNPYILFDLDAL